MSHKSGHHRDRNLAPVWAKSGEFCPLQSKALGTEGTPDHPQIQISHPEDFHGLTPSSLQGFPVQQLGGGSVGGWGPGLVTAIPAVPKSRLLLD